MAQTSNRNFKILGAAWLVLGGLALAFAFITLFPLAQGDGPSAEAVSEGYWVFALLALVMGAAGMVSGLALLRRSRIARPALVTSSVLLLPTVSLVVPLVVVGPSLWLTLTRSGKEVLESYMAKDNS